MPHPSSHGIAMYFTETARNARRVSLTLLSVSLAIAVALLVAGRRVSETVLDPMRFGFEGPEQWVERIRLEELAQQSSPGTYAITYLTLEARKGGASRQQRSSHPNATVNPETSRGDGEDSMDLLAKARMLAVEGPVVRSEDLIIERLVRPEYPEEARDQGVEGVVELLALVDTTGVVEQIHIVGGTREPMLERAAATAILECRYRPYRVRDQALRVWAAFRIAFSLY